jgi:hypothetical protein
MKSQVDPRRASVGFVYADLGAIYGQSMIGRVYYWFDGIHEAVDDDVLREQHPEISDEEWQQLFAAAFDRGEREFLKGLKRDCPAMFTSEDGLLAAFLGYTFGRCSPSAETLAALGLTAPDSASDEPGSDPERDETRQSQSEERSAA